MIHVTEKQSLKRFSALPAKLQDALFSLQVAETIGRIAEQNNIPESKVSHIADVAGLVLMGFIHPEEAAKEIQERSGIDAETAKSISASLNARIFSSLQNEIELAYAPLPEEPREPEPPKEEESSRVVEEIKQLKRSGAELIDVLKKKEEKSPIFPSGLKRPVDAPKSAPLPGSASAAKPSPMAINFDKPAAPSKPKISSPPSWPEKGSLSELSDPLSALGSDKEPKPKNQGLPGKKTGLPKQAPFSPSPSPSSSSAEPEPVILHKESEIAPRAPMGDFHLELPENKLEGKNTSPEGLRQPAKLDIGGEAKQPKGPAKTKVIAPKVVHYKSSDIVKTKPSSTLDSLENSSPKLKSIQEPPPQKNASVSPAEKFKGFALKEDKNEKPGWLKRILHRSKPDSRKSSASPAGIAPAPVKEVSYTAEEELKKPPKKEKPLSPPVPPNKPEAPAPPKIANAGKNRVDSAPSPAANPPPNLPVSSKSEEEVIDLSSLKKLQK